ncbi:MAG: thiamine diphosphokinase [Treponema sp.]|nr:thiamine diphosphokinase [Treponema sp.]
MHILIFTGGMAPEPGSASFFLKQAPEADFIIAADSGLDTLEEYRKFYAGEHDFEPDLILGDFDSIKDRTLLERYAHVRTEPYDRDKDFTDTELALIHAAKKASSREKDMITLLGGDGGRIDHLIAIYDSFSEDYHADVWLTSSCAVWYVGDGRSLEFSGGGKDGSVSFARTTERFSGSRLETCGLEWEGPVFREHGMASISNRIKAEYLCASKPVTVRARGGAFLAFLPLDAAVRRPGGFCSLG